MSYRKTVQNLWLAFFFNGVGVPLAATGIVQPSWAMAAMATSVTLVLANSFGGYRSEEHTSELQSLMRISYAVFCLKKKNKQSHTHKQLNQNTIHKPTTHVTSTTA